MKNTTVARTIVMVAALGAMSTLATAQERAATARAAAAQVPVKKAGRTAPQTPRASSAAMTQGFNVVLVLGDLEGGGAGPDNVPAAARKALADMKDFLPYKGYRLLDTAWILSANESTTATLRGVDEREYELTLGATAEPAGAVSNGALRVRFRLRDSSTLREVALPSREGAAESPTPTLDYLKAQMARDAERRANLERENARRRTQIAELEKRAEATEAELRTLKERLNERHPQVVAKQAELMRIMEQLAAVRTAEIGDAKPGFQVQLVARTRAEMERQLLELTRGRGIFAPAQNIIDTGFTMTVGETVVVGTSRVGGDKAILALLTAVPRSIKKQP